jgi:hypothetical protein
MWINDYCCYLWISHVSKSSLIMISWVLHSRIPSRTNLWPGTLRIDHKIVLWVEENSHVMLFCQQTLLQLWSHSYFLSHTRMGSICLCYVNFLLVMFSNGVRLNDWWCRDETESLLWCTHGWAARHALVSRSIVVIHCETILMCYLLWTLSEWSLHFVSICRDILTKSVFSILSDILSWICIYLQSGSYMFLHP